MHAFPFGGMRMLTCEPFPKKPCHFGLTHFANPCTMRPIKLQSARSLSPRTITFLTA